MSPPDRAPTNGPQEADNAAIRENVSMKHRAILATVEKSGPLVMLKIGDVVVRSTIRAEEIEDLVETADILNAEFVIRSSDYKRGIFDAD